jgi:hypothetical protein
MLLPGVIASSASFGIVAASAVGIGFMVRFFVALANDGRNVRVGRRVRVEAAPFEADVCQRPARRRMAIDSGTHLAMGVLRITTVLSPTPVRSPRSEASQPSLVGGSMAAERPPHPASRRLYRVG